MPNSSQLPDQDDSISNRVIGDTVRLLAINQLDERLQRYRLAQPKLEQQMLKSFRDYGQLSPVVVCQLDGQTVLVDGFKRLRAARTLKGHEQIVGRFLEADEQGAKAAIFNLNRVTGRPVELEEAWIIYALVIDDGLQQIEVAQMLGRHKSWVNRRLALIERLCNEARESLRLGLMTPTQARHLTRLPRGNQNEAMRSAAHAALTSRELSDMVDLLIASSTQQQVQFVLEQPRQAIAQSQDHHIHHWDPRLSAAGNKIAKRLGFLLDSLSKMNTWLRFEGRGQLQACDRVPLLSGFTKLQQEAPLLIEANDDFIKELQLP
jgi:ParB-like chromosome segregation protein Spo0J